MIRAIQSIHSPALDQFFLFVTDLHHETVYILLLPLMLWLYDKRFTRYMTSVFLLGYWSNGLMKDFFHTGRPSPDDVRVVRPETSGAFPSGHSQNPLMFWGALALQVRKTWVTVALVVVIFLIGLSRLYLGVHWPLDVIGGWTIGALMLLGFEVTRSFWIGDGMKLGQKLFWALAIPSAAFLVSALAGQVPALSTPKEAAGEVFLVTGAYFGFWIGSILEEEWVRFDPRLGGLLIQVLKVVIGVALIMAVKEGFKLFLPATALGDLIRYFFVALMATLGAPWVFSKMVPAAPTVGRGIAK